MKLYYETISEMMKTLVLQLMSIPGLSDFRLVGGTSLALQFGHRTSVDIVLFAGGKVDVKNLLEIIRENFKEDFILLTRARNGITGVIRGIKVDIFDWKVPFAQDVVLTDGLRLASAQDIFAYKCESILDRKSEKDFCDIAEKIKVSLYYNGLHFCYPFKKRKYCSR